jgi:hypothetical protein
MCARVRVLERGKGKKEGEEGDGEGERERERERVCACACACSYVRARWCDGVFLAHRQILLRVSEERHHGVLRDTIRRASDGHSDHQTLDAPHAPERGVRGVSESGVT